jgi:hypothetical protein
MTVVLKLSLIQAIFESKEEEIMLYNSIFTDWNFLFLGKKKNEWTWEALIRTFN